MISIPYAKAPVGELRWKAPQAPDPSDETFDAGEFGLAALQAYSPSEVASSMPKGEDCLTLNVWTKDLDAASEYFEFSTASDEKTENNEYLRENIQDNPTNEENSFRAGCAGTLFCLQYERKSAPYGIAPSFRGSAVRQNSVQ